VGEREENAVVLDSRPYRERDLILSVLTGTDGVVRGVLRGARGKRHARGAAASQILSLVTISWFQRATAAPRHFRLARGLLDALLASTPPETVLAYALLWVLRLGGVFPEPGRCSACGEPTGERVCLAPGTGHPLCSACAPPGSAGLGSAALRFVEASRAAGPSEPLPPPPRGLVLWLERLARAEAHRPLRALDMVERLS